MAPKKKDSGSAAPATATHEYAVGDIVLGKVKGYPDWPAQIVDHDVGGKEVLKAKGTKNLLLRFFPDADFQWATARELKPLTAKAIAAYLDAGAGRKKGNLLTAYTIAQDPKEWEESLKNGAAAGMDEDEVEDDEEVDGEDVDMLDEDAENGKKKAKAGAKGKKAAGDKKTPASKGKKRKNADDDSEPASKTAKKAKSDPAAKKGAAAAKKAAEEKKSASAPSADDSEGAKTVKGWRATLQKAFLTKGVPSEDKMPEFDKIFTAMEEFEMQTEWLTVSKLGKVLKKLSTLSTELARESEFKLKERSSALIEKWKEMLAKEGEDAEKVVEAGAPSAAPAAEEKKTEEAGDLTVMEAEEAAPAAPAAEEEKKVETEEKAAEPAAEEKKETNGDASAAEQKEGVNAPGQTNGETEEKKDEPATTTA